MSDLAQALIAELDDAALDRLAELLAPRLQSRLGHNVEQDRWFNSQQAAEYLGCPRSRIHDLVQLGLLTPARDGRRLAFRKSDLDRYMGEPSA